MQLVAIALDLGGTQVRAALVDARGSLIARRAVATAATAGPAAVIEQLANVAISISEGVTRDRIIGIGLSAPGPLDTNLGMAHSIPTLAGFVELPLAKMLAERTGLQVWIENDGIAAAIGEWRFGAARNYANVVYITVSTGIGGGVIADNRVLRGRRGMAGHVGHVTIVRDGVECSCGNRGCWEAYGSGTAFARRARARAAEDITSALHASAALVDGAAVFAAAEKGDALSQALIAEEADLLGVGIANLFHVYSPDIVVVGGGMSTNFETLYPGLAARVHMAAMPAFRDTPVVRAQLQDNSGLVGAAVIAFDAAKAVRSIA